MGGFGTADWIVLLILLVIVILAVGYLVRAKKRGQTCIGCPNGSNCGAGCHCEEKKK